MKTIMYFLFFGIELEVRDANTEHSKVVQTKSILGVRVVLLYFLVHLPYTSMRNKHP